MINIYYVFFIFRLKVQKNYAKGNKLEKLTIEDFYVYRENQTNLNTKYFYNVVIELDEKGRVSYCLRCAVTIIILIYLTCES